MNQLSLVPDVVADEDCWATPRSLFVPLNYEFEFTYDLAAQDWSAKCERYFTIVDNALIKDWHKLEGWLFVNPPFSAMEVWTAKAAREAALGAHIVMVMPGHRHEQGWFHTFVQGRAHEVRIYAGRIAYVNPPGLDKSSAPFPSFVAVYDGPNPEGVTMLVSR